MGSVIDEAALHNYFFSRCGTVKSIRTQVGQGTGPFVGSPSWW